jgi:hypothetical protein
MNRKPISYFHGSFLFTLLAIMGGYLLAGLAGAVIVGFLTVLETSLSFDNAVVNASVLKSWDEVWRRRFLVWGMLVAVFGMRLVFPLAIVGVVGHLGPWQVVTLALEQPAEYARVLTAAHHEVAAFGGTFLMMVFWKYFMDANKHEHWLAVVEAPLTRLGQIEAVEAALTLLILIGFSSQLEGAHRVEFIVAGIYGLVTFVLAKGLGTLLGGEGGEQLIRQGVGGFLYLELLDASFSFDGVIGAFAMSNNLFVIALGLGAGAMFVRSFTLLLVEKGTLDTYRYLEHGAFWAIGALAAIMFISVSVEVPEVVTGLLGAALIAASLLSSVFANRRQA